MHWSPPAAFLCPLRGPCFASAGPPFPSYGACNDAVARYQASASDTDRQAQAQEIYRRCLPLARKTLHRFCHSFHPNARCYPGACLPEDLLGETYSLFRQALDEFDPTRGVNFLGYASHRLFWGLEHHARRWERERREREGIEAAVEAQPAGAEEDRVLARVLVRDLLGQLSRDEAELLTRYAEGYPRAQLAEHAGLSSAALRKRIERLREKARRLVGTDRPAAPTAGRAAAPSGPW